MQAGSNVPGNLKNVEKLVEHPAFSITNPNACYSLFLGFLRSPVNFHAADGSGYKFLADSILKVCARHSTAFAISWDIIPGNRDAERTCLWLLLPRKRL